MIFTLFFDVWVLLIDAKGRSGRAVGKHGVRRGSGDSGLEDGDVGVVGDASGDEIIGERAAWNAGMVTVRAGKRKGEELAKAAGGERSYKAWTHSF